MEVSMNWTGHVAHMGETKETLRELIA